MDSRHIFALDIGTRSVVGIILEVSDDRLRIFAADGEEHHSRSMRDGQIHDVEAVAEVVKRIKQRLEQQVNHPLREVAVAAAGRALQTIRCTVENRVGYSEEISKDDILALELQGVQEAQRMLLQDGTPEDFSYQCVGYSVVNYRLNGQRIKNLLGQRGEVIALEILATFLPREVVDSMFAVLDRAGLEMTGLTLEPIAASEVVIPESMRQLSLALVDVGAGTSDIALCSDGTMAAYAMVPEAGDEVTETLAEAYLLDFNEAERLKRMAGTEEILIYHDVLGHEHCITPGQMVKDLAGRVNDLAAKIADKILTLAVKPVQAVICIGGGSQTPGLAKALADSLGLPVERAAIRGREVVSAVSGDHILLKGPEAITPLGIGVTAMRGHGLGFSRVTVNGRPVRLFELNRGTVGDALLAAGVDSRRLRGRPGMSLSITINGVFKVIKGTLGSPGTITVNGRPARLDTRVAGGDEITLQDAVDGQDAKAVVGDLLPELINRDYYVYINGETISLQPSITMNAQPVSPDEPVVDLAELCTVCPVVLAELLPAAGYPHLDAYLLTVNGLEATRNTKVEPGDNIKVVEIQQERVWEQDNFAEVSEPAGGNQPSAGNQIGEESEPKEESKPEEGNQPEGKSQPGEMISPAVACRVILNGQPLEIVSESNKLMFYDVLRHIDFPAKAPFSGAELRLEVNGCPAAFTMEIKAGDRLVLEWRRK